MGIGTKLVILPGNCRIMAAPAINHALWEDELLAFLGHMILSLLIALVTGVAFYWLWDRFAPKA